MDRRDVHLTGHSMGGQGAWHLAANDLDGFATVAPSAAWASFDSYCGRPPGTRSDLWHAADGASLTAELLQAAGGEPRVQLEPDEVVFETVHPSVDSEHHWLLLHQPLRYGEPARLGGQRFEGEDLACVALLPRADAANGLVGLLAAGWWDARWNLAQRR